jgi:hypothetical protein
MTASHPFLRRIHHLPACVGLARNNERRAAKVSLPLAEVAW